MTPLILAGHTHQPSKALVAYDRITVDGFGQTGVKIQRHVVGPPSRTLATHAPSSTAVLRTPSTTAVPTTGPIPGSTP